MSVYEWFLMTVFFFFCTKINFNCFQIVQCFVSYNSTATIIDRNHVQVLHDRQEWVRCTVKERWSMLIILFFFFLILLMINGNIRIFKRKFKKRLQLSGLYCNYSRYLSHIRYSKFM